MLVILQRSDRNTGQVVGVKIGGNCIWSFCCYCVTVVQTDSTLEFTTVYTTHMYITKSDCDSSYGKSASASKPISRC